MPEELKLKALPSDDEVERWTIGEFIAGAANGVISNDDGIGYWATHDAESNWPVSPADAVSRGFRAPDWASQIIWYTK
jgi:hypothetical protein